MLIERLEKQKEGMQTGLKRKLDDYAKRRKDLVRSFSRKVDEATYSLQSHYKKPEKPLPLNPETTSISLKSMKDELREKVKLTEEFYKNKIQCKE